MENLKYGISQKRLIVEGNGRKFGTWGTTVHICRVILMPDSWSYLRNSRTIASGNIDVLYSTVRYDQGNDGRVA